jgi:hypothetical protein
MKVAISQKTATFVTTAVRTSHPATHPFSERVFSKCNKKYRILIVSKSDISRKESPTLKTEATNSSFPLKATDSFKRLMGLFTQDMFHQIELDDDQRQG